MLIYVNKDKLNGAYKIHCKNFNLFAMFDMLKVEDIGIYCIKIPVYDGHIYDYINTINEFCKIHNVKVEDLYNDCIYVIHDEEKFISNLKLFDEKIEKFLNMLLAGFNINNIEYKLTKTYPYVLTYSKFFKYKTYCLKELIDFVEYEIKQNTFYKIDNIVKVINNESD